VKDLQVLSSPELFRRVVHVVAHFGFGVWDRDVIAHVFGVDLCPLLNTDSDRDPRSAVFVVVNECSPAHIEDYDDVETLPEIPKHTVRMRGRPGGVLFEKIDEENTRVTVVSRNDPMLSSRLNWVLELIQKQVAHKALEKYGKIAAKLPKEYVARLDEKQDQYDDLRARLRS
jgi:hypothetical protein